MRKFAIAIPIYDLTRYPDFSKWGDCHINGYQISASYYIMGNKKYICRVRPNPGRKKILRYKMLKPIFAGDIVIKGGIMNKNYALLICETNATISIVVDGAKIFEFKEEINE